MNSKHDEASAVLCLKFDPCGLDLYLVCLDTLQKCHEILDLTCRRSHLSLFRQSHLRVEDNGPTT